VEFDRPLDTITDIPKKEVVVVLVPPHYFVTVVDCSLLWLDWWLLLLVKAPVEDRRKELAAPKSWKRDSTARPWQYHFQ